ncbi:nicotinamide-nucleotide amidohydrolase PncC [Spirochaetota bacterium]|nr:nicotinamide-nucleotide amidohydrolase PncC [Spirochaetota bacterium]
MKFACCCIISIGTELTEGRTLNTNAFHLADILTQYRLHVTRMLTLRDDIDSIVTTLRTFNSSATKKPARRKTSTQKHASPEPIELIELIEQIVIITGGLGATSDDLSVEAIAKALNRKIIIHSGHLAHLTKIMQSRNLPNRFLKQARIPSGFQAETHHLGTAPFLYQLQKPPATSFFMLPGVPSECISLCKTRVLPLIKSHFFKNSPPPPIHKLTFKAIGLSETRVEATIDALKIPNLTCAYLPHYGELLVVLKTTQVKNLAGARTPSALLHFARTKIIAQLRKIHTPLIPNTPSFVYSNEKSLLTKLHDQFIAKKWKIGIAESCTGGLLTAAFAAKANASKYLMTGIIPYHNKAKIAHLNITTLDNHGAVSTETAQAMAQNLADQFYSQKIHLDLTLSITGIAGPSGGTKIKPVGTVYICFYLPKSKQFFTKRLLLKGSRTLIQTQTVTRSIVFLGLFLHAQTQLFKPSRK